MPTINEVLIMADDETGDLPQSQQSCQSQSSHISDDDDGANEESDHYNELGVVERSKKMHKLHRTIQLYKQTKLG